MGKFFEALKKSQGISKQQPKPPARKIITRLAETVENMVVDKMGTPAPTQELLFSRNGMDPRLVSFLEPGSIASEVFKMLRAKILTRDSKSRPRTIMVTGPEPLDGKTIVSTNLAISIAQGINEHVMLVDCDLRNPSLARLLGIKSHSGLRNYLEDGKPLAPHLINTSIAKLTLLPAGKVPPNPSELLSSEKMRLLVEELKVRYENRYIIFDATPAQFAAETTFLASMVDGVLLVISSGKTGRDSILQAIENIDRNKIIGIVFNASSEAPKAYGYYYKYYRKGQK